MINGYIALTKPRIISLLLITALGGLFLASGGFPDPITTVVVLVGGSLAAGGANAINHFLDRDIDVKMSRTSQRPLVSGARFMFCCLCIRYTCAAAVHDVRDAFPGMWIMMYVVGRRMGSTK